MTSRIIGGIFLVASLAIGAGMLALPIATGNAGFITSIISLLVVFLLMFYSILLLLEASLYSALGTNIIGMVKEQLGLKAQVIAWCVYLFLLYAVLAAYTTGGQAIIGNALIHFFHTDLPHWCDALLFIFIFGFFVYFGTLAVDYLNRLLTIGLIVTYALLSFFVVPHVHAHLLHAGHVHAIWVGIPVIVLSFASHLIVPSLRSYYKDNLKHLLIVLVIGSCLPLILYALWQLIVLGIIPIQGVHSLVSIQNSKHTTTALTEALSWHTGVFGLGQLAVFFSFFALVTSFLGASLSLNHFLKDGLNASDKTRSRLIIITLTYLPPFIFAMNYPEGFVFALGYAGVAVAILFGIIPTLMVWRGRYQRQLSTKFRVPGGKPMLIVMLLASALIIILQIAVTIGLIK